MIALAVLVSLGEPAKRIVLMERVGIQFYLDWVPGDPQVFEIASGDVIAGLAFAISRMIDSHARDNAICGEHVSDIHALDHAPGMSGVDSMTVVIASAYFRVGLLEGDETINLLSGNAV